jgi:hypothetical protein
VRCWVCDCRRSICRDELHDWPTSGPGHLRALSQAACAVIDAQPRISDPVFARRSGETPIVGYRKMWLRIAKLGDLPADITPHVLRRSFASLAADLGYNDPTIATFSQGAQHHQQVRPFRRCHVTGSSRCRGECHHEADGVGSSRNPSCGISISRVGRNHLSIGVFVPREIHPLT